MADQQLNRLTIMRVMNVQMSQVLTSDKSEGVSSILVTSVRKINMLV